MSHITHSPDLDKLEIQKVTEGWDFLTSCAAVQFDPHQAVKH